MEYTRRYLMDGLHNLRDLGGYAVPGGITRFGVLLRSDLPWHLTEDDGKRFAALEVRHTLDLRDVDESESMPDELALLRRRVLPADRDEKGPSRRGAKPPRRAERV